MICPHDTTGLTCPTRDRLREFTKDKSRYVFDPGQRVRRVDLYDPFPIESFIWDADCRDVVRKKQLGVLGKVK